MGKKRIIKKSGKGLDQGRKDRALSKAVKKRLERAREVLGARNAVHAVAIATRRGLIFSDPTF